MAVMTASLAVEMAAVSIQAAMRICGLLCWRVALALQCRGEIEGNIETGSN
jgi:hypothetical protein